MASEKTGSDLISMAVGGGSRALAVAERLATAFVENASPGEILKLGTLWKEAREAEAKAGAQVARIDANQARALASLQAKLEAFESVAGARMARTDRALDLLISKLGEAHDSDAIGAIADAIAKVAATDRLSDLAEVLHALDAGQDDLDF